MNVNIRKIQDYNNRAQVVYAKKHKVEVDIQNIGKNTSALAQPEEPYLNEIHSGVWLRKDVIHFSDGNFTNVYDLFWDKNNLKLEPVVYSEKKPYYMLDYTQSDPSILAVINGSYFFLVDFPEKEPKDYPFHFCIRDNRVMGLLSSDEAIVFIREGEIFAQDGKAYGTIKINNKVVNWIGSGADAKHKKIKHSATLYNSGSVKLIKEFDPRTGVRVGRLDYKTINTPQKPGVTDLVINNVRGKLKISQINIGGGTHCHEGLFILQIDSKGNVFKVGDLIEPLTMGDLKLQGISDGVTIGKSVSDPYFFTPERINSRDARSVVAQDRKGNTHFIVFDGSKYIPNFKGVSANDVKDYFSKDKFNWGFFLDGGSSSRIIIKEHGKREFLANDFAFKKVTNEIFLWDSKRHRKLASVIALKVRKN